MAEAVSKKDSNDCKTKNSVSVTVDPLINSQGVGGTSVLVPLERSKVTLDTQTTANEMMRSDEAVVSIDMDCTCESKMLLESLDGSNDNNSENWVTDIQETQPEVAADEMVRSAIDSTCNSESLDSSKDNNSENCMTDIQETPLELQNARYIVLEMVSEMNSCKASDVTRANTMTNIAHITDEASKCSEDPACEHAKIKRNIKTDYIDNVDQKNGNVQISKLKRNEDGKEKKNSGMNKPMDEENLPKLSKQKIAMELCPQKIKIDGIVNCTFKDCEILIQNKLKEFFKKKSLIELMSLQMVKLNRQHTYVVYPVSNQERTPVITSVTGMEDSHRTDGNIHGGNLVYGQVRRVVVTSVTVTDPPNLPHLLNLPPPDLLNLPPPDLPYIHQNNIAQGGFLAFGNTITLHSQQQLQLNQPEPQVPLVHVNTQPAPAQQQLQPNQAGLSELEYLRRENRRLKDRKVCMKCKIEDANILCLPCQHCKMCQECADNTLLCPLCDRNIAARIKTYAC